MQDYNVAVFEAMDQVEKRKVTKEGKESKKKTEEKKK